MPSVWHVEIGEMQGLAKVKIVVWSQNPRSRFDLALEVIVDACWPP